MGLELLIHGETWLLGNMEAGKPKIKWANKCGKQVAGSFEFIIVIIVSNAIHLQVTSSLSFLIFKFNHCLDHINWGLLSWNGYVFVIPSLVITLS